MKSFSLDTNCILAVDNNEPTKSNVLKLVEAHRCGLIDIAFIAVSASERQRGGVYLPTFGDFQNRLEALGLSDIPQIQGLAVWGLSYWGHAIWADDAMSARDRAFHRALFPSISPIVQDTVADASCDTEKSRRERKWRNAWCDRQMIWAHENVRRDVFVTSDRNFKDRLVGQPTFAHLKIATPEEAEAMI